MTSEDIDNLGALTKEEMEASIKHLQYELSKVRTGRASASILDGILVAYYGNPTPLNQVASIATSDARTINIQPWEKNMLGPIEKAIFEANLGYTPMNDGEFIRISIPPLTEERRKEMVKICKGLGEDAKVSIRSTRHKAMDAIKKAVKDGYPEDAGKRKEDEVQKLTDSYGDKVDDLVKAKEKDVMTV
jgi:ribosome recycling factor